MSLSSQRQQSTSTSLTSADTTKGGTIVDHDEEKEFIDDITSSSGVSGSMSNHHSRRNAKEMMSSSSNMNNNVRPLTFNTHTHSAPTFDGMKPHLSTLEDDHSTYMAVSRACLFLNHFASYGSSSIGIGMGGRAAAGAAHQSTLLELSQCTSNFSSILRTLSSAASNHSDRRCRILALNTLSIVSKSALGLLIVSPVFMDKQDVAWIMRLQDEICNDVVLNMLSCALEDDDGVAAVAFEALGRLVIDIHDDDFHKEVRDIMGLSCPPMFTSQHGLWTGVGLGVGTGEEEDGTNTGTGTNNNNNNSSEVVERFVSRFQDYDAAMYNSEIRWRILESVLSPRARKILNRIQWIKCTESQLRCLPFLNELVVFVYKNDMLAKLTFLESNVHNCDRDTFAKRWYEFDIAMMVDEYVKTILMTLLNKFQNSEGNSSDYTVEIAVGVATNALVLCSAARCQEPWLEQLISLSLDNLDRGLSQVQDTRCIEQQMTLLSCVLVVLRGIQGGKVKRLQQIARVVRRLPSTLVVPQGAVVSALQLHDGSRRRPSRCGFWTEIALHFFLPSDFMEGYPPNGGGGIAIAVNANKSTAVEALADFLGSSSNRSMISRRGGVLDPAEEMMYSFCTVAYAVGKALAPPTSNANKTDGIDNDDDDDINLVSTLYDCKNWIDASIVLLNYFAPSLSWNSDAEMKTLERSSTLLSAAHRSYIELLRLVLIYTGTVLTSTSIYSNFCPSHVGADPDATGAGKAQGGKSVLLEVIKSTTIENDITILTSELLEVCSTAKLSQVLRLSLLCLLSDVWIQQCRLVSEVQSISSNRDLRGPVDVDEDIIHFNEATARTLLSLLGAEISTLIAGEKKRMTQNLGSAARKNTVSAAEALRYLLMCVACVESIAYTAHLSANQFASSGSGSNAEDEESARYIVSVCIVVLKGQGKIESDEHFQDEEPVSKNLDDSEVSDATGKSPPRSPKSRARITTFTSECSDAAKRLRDFVGIQEDFTSDFDDPNPKVVMDFNCLCPLFKRSSFDIPFDESDEKLLSNDEWKLADQCAVVAYSQNRVVPSLSHTDISLEYMLGPRRFIESQYDRSYLMHLYRQHLAQRINTALLSSPVQKFHEGSELNINPNGNEHTHTSVLQRNLKAKQSLRVRNALSRLSVRAPPFDGIDIKKSWKETIHSVTGCSEPISAVLNYSVRRQYNYDGTIEFKLVVTVQLYNITPIPIPNGLQLELQISPTVTNATNVAETRTQHSTRATATFQKELHAGQRLIWEVIFDPSNLWCSEMNLNLSITLNNIEMELESAVSDIVRLDLNREAGEQSIVTVETDGASGMLNSDNVNEVKVDTMAVGIHCETVLIPHEISLFPCPQVFYLKCDHNHGFGGDENMFLFLWLSVPHRFSPIAITLGENEVMSAHYSFLSNPCHLKIRCDGQPTDAWALETWCGKHLLLLHVNSSDPNGEIMEKSGKLYVRSDDAGLMESLFSV